MLNRIQHLFQRRYGLPASAPVTLVVGPESTGTRIFTDIFSRHPRALGTDAALQHHDVLDTVWQMLEQGRCRDAARALAELPRERFVITRRSMPHGSAPGVAAKFGDFPDLGRFVQACAAASRRVQLLVTTRSPAACIASSVARRTSVARNPELALRQYGAAYNAIFAVAARHRLPFFIVSVEALVLDGDAYVQSLFALAGMGAAQVDLHAGDNPNTARYREFPALVEAHP
jgi:hypothetical protein